MNHGSWQPLFRKKPTWRERLPKLLMLTVVAGGSYLYLTEDSPASLTRGGGEFAGQEHGIIQRTLVLPGQSATPPGDLVSAGQPEASWFNPSQWLDDLVELIEPAAEQLPAAEQVQPAVATSRSPDAAPNAILAEPAALSLQDEVDSPQQTAPASPEPAMVKTQVDKGPRKISEQVRKGDNLALMFKRMQLSPVLLSQITSSGQAGRKLADIRPGHALEVEFDAEGAFARLNYQVSATRNIVAFPGEDGIESRFVDRDVELRTQTVTGIIESSLFHSADRAGISDNLTMKMAQIFRWDIDFAHEVRPGDQFTVVFEEEWLDGEKVGDGAILAAEFINQGDIHRAIRYEMSNGDVAYYTPDGKQMRKAFTRTPVKFSRISSGFTGRRWHPVLKRWRSHKGVDYAAPTGTPVRATGDGVISFRGRQGGYGNVVFVKHGDTYTTVYGHLSKFARSMGKGKSVKQGQIIGYVGMTGLASGPHLHYEFRVKGKHKNPLTVKLPKSLPLPKKLKNDFQRKAQVLIAKLDQAQTTMMASAEQP